MPQKSGTVIVGQRRERHRRVVCGLHFQRVPVDGPAVEPRPGARLQPADRQVRAQAALPARWMAPLLPVRQV